MREQGHTCYKGVGGAHALPTPCFLRHTKFNVSAAQAASGIRMDLISALEGLVPELEKGLDQASSFEGLEALRVDFLGRKGRIAQIMSRLPSLAPEQRPDGANSQQRQRTLQCPV